MIFTKNDNDKEVTMNTYDKVSAWNEKAGKRPYAVGTKDYWLSLQNQFNRISEELQELYDAIENKDIAGVIDALLDLDVTVAGGSYLANYNYNRGINYVLNNNDLKVTTDEDKAYDWAKFWENNGEEVEVCASDYDGVRYFSVHRTSDDKIMKYGNFPEVDLSSIVPEPVPEEFILINDTDNMSDKAKLSSLTKLYMEDLDDPSGLMRAIMDSSDKNEIVLTIVNGDLVNTGSL